VRAFRRAAAVLEGLLAVFAACRENGVAVEINCRPERMDPPDPLLRLAAETGRGLIRGKPASVRDDDCDFPGPGAESGNDRGVSRKRNRDLFNFGLANLLSTT